MNNILKGKDNDKIDNENIVSIFNGGTTIDTSPITEDVKNKIVLYLVPPTALSR